MSRALDSSRRLVFHVADDEGGDHEISVRQHALCTTEQGFAGYVDCTVDGRRVQIVGRYDDPAKQKDPMGKSYIDQHVYVDGEYLPRREADETVWIECANMTDETIMIFVARHANVEV